MYSTYITAHWRPRLNIKVKKNFSCILSHCGTNPGFFQKLHYHFSYINDVEVFAPGYSCSYKMLTPYPHKVKGTVSGFLMGSVIVCGGGEMIYVDCTKHNEGSKQCDRNYECVETTGGTQWCTGPKTDLCYAYDSVSKGAIIYLFFFQGGKDITLLSTNLLVSLGIMFRKS